METIKTVGNTTWHRLYLVGFATNSFPAHSCDARTGYGIGVSNVFGIDGAIFHSVASHHGLELGVRGVACHGLAFVSNYGIVYLIICEAFKALVDGLNHCHGQCGWHVKVEKAAAYTIWFAVKGDVFALGGSGNPFASSVVTDGETFIF
jgi:hypothetical protein